MSFGDDKGKGGLLQQTFGRVGDLLGPAFGYKMQNGAGAPPSAINSPSAGGPAASGTKSLLGGVQ